MSAQPSSLHAQLRLGGVRVSAASHCIVHPSDSGASSAAHLLATALAQMHPHALRFEPLTEAAYLKQKSDDAGRSPDADADAASPGPALRLPILVGRCEELLSALGWQDALNEVAAGGSEEEGCCDWSVSTHAIESTTGLLFLGAASTPEEETRNLLAAVMWFGKEILACNLDQLLTEDHAPVADPSSAGAGSSDNGADGADGRSSPKPNALMNLVRLHVRHRYAPSLRSSLGLSGDPRLRRMELVRHTQSMELLLDGENSDMTIDLSQATDMPLPRDPVPSPQADAPAAAEPAEAQPAPSPSPSPSPPVLPASLDPNYVPKKHTPRQPLQGSVGSSSGPSASAAGGATPFTKPMLAVDLDEVLGDFVPQMVLFHNERYGTKLRASDFYSYHFASVLGVSNEESQDRVHAFFESTYFEDLPVVAGAQEALRALRQRFDLTVVTSRQHFIEPLTRRWLERHFEGLFNGGVFFGNHYGTSGVVKSKPDMCAAIGAVALVDDSLTYARQCAHTLERVFLFGDYAWNKLAPSATGAAPEPLPANVIRCAGWADVLKAVEGWTPEPRAPEQPMAPGLEPE